MADEPAVWVDGSLVPAGRATVPALDRGLLFGEGVFETLKAVDGEPFAVRRHLLRLRHGLESMGLTIPWSDDELRGALSEVATAHGRPLARVRITATAGTTTVAAFPLEPTPPTATACTSPWPWNERGPLAGVKTTSRAELVRALARAQAQGCDEALTLTTTGLVCEATGANVFLVVDGRPRTPSLASGCLPGVTRELVLEWTDAEPAELPASAHAGCAEAFLTSSTRDVQPLALIDGRPLPAPGPVTRAVMAAFAEHAATDPDP